MEVMVTKLTLLLVLMNCVALNCQFQSKSSIVIQGSVFVHDSLTVHSSIFEERNQYPFSGLRIDSVNHNLLMVKYHVHEFYMDVDFSRAKESDEFMSNGWMLARPEIPIEIDSVRLEVVSPDSIFLHVNGETHLYRFSYVDKVDMKTHRNPYYAEEGFTLFERK